MTMDITTATMPEAPRIEDELDFAITALREAAGIELAAVDADELLSGVEDYDLAAHHLREVARLFDKHAGIGAHMPDTVADWAAMSHYDKLMELARFSDTAVGKKLFEITEDLRIESIAGLEMEAYRTGNIPRETLATRLVELADGDAGILQWLRTTPRFACAWHDDSVESFKEGAR